MNLSWPRIKAVLLHSYYHTTHSVETWVDLGWFTIIQLAVFGSMSTFFAGTNEELGRNLLLGFFCWEVVRIGQYCVTVTLLWEVWAHSLTTIFISPLTLIEFFVGQMIAGIIKTLGIVLTLSVLSKVLFGFWIFTLGPISLAYILLLLITSYGVGLTISSLIIRFGTDIQSLAWGLVFLLQPISAIYYPVEALPSQVRWIAFASPITFVMETARMQLATKTINWNYLIAATLLAFTYLAVGCFLLNTMYKKSKKLGTFARLGY